MDTATRRAKLVNEAIELAYDSLQSHLYWTVRTSAEGKNFHKAAIRDYATIIKNLTQLY